MCDQETLEQIVILLAEIVETLEEVVDESYSESLKIELEVLQELIKN